MPPTRTMQLAAPKENQALTPQQKRFNALIRQIEQARETLAAWHEGIALFRQAHATNVLPVIEELEAARRQTLLALDALLDEAGWTRAERQTLGELACDAAIWLLHADETDAQAREILAKHSQTDWDAQRRGMLQATQSIVESMTGLDLGDDADLHTDADLLQRLRERALEDAQEAAAAQAAAPRRRKTAAQQRRELEAQQATQSVRDIYRKLASALHPDRESDPQRHKIKTGLMQKVNQAYAANDLLGLLELQLQIEQVDLKAIAGAGARKLQGYNQILAGQLARLKEDIEQVDLAFRFEFGLEPGFPIAPRKLGALVGQQVRELRWELGQLQTDLRLLADRASAKRWLKRQRQILRATGPDSPFF